MTAAVPAALAVAGTALMAAAFFGPFRRGAGLAPPPETAQTATAQWPALVASAAADCDAQARIDLVDALGRLQSEWAQTVLREAHAGEPDPGVRAAIAAALSSSQSLVT